MVTQARPDAPPHYPSAEATVVGAVLVEPGVIDTVMGILDPLDFFDPRHRHMYEAALALWERRESIDQVTLGAELARAGVLDEVGGHVYLNQVVAELPTTVGIEHHARMVQRAAAYRDLIRAAGDIVQIGYEAGPDLVGSLADAEDKLLSIRGAEKIRDFTRLPDLLAGFLEPEDADGDTAAEAVRTGFGDLDALVGAMQPSDLLVLAARPSVGKSALALTVARNAAIGQEINVAVFSLEMSALQVATRLVSSESGVDSQRLPLGRHTDEEEARISRAIGVLSRANIFVDDTAGQTIAEIRAKSRRLHQLLLDQNRRSTADDAEVQPSGLGLVIVDHIQLVHAWSRNPVETNRVSEISYISRALKELARDLQVPVLAVSQLSRAVESRHPHVPMLSDLRESGSIEQDADLVIFIYREDMYVQPDEWEDERAEEPFPRGVAQLIVAKHRNGPTGTVHVRFIRNIARFEDMLVREDGPAGGEFAPADALGFQWSEPGNGGGNGGGNA